MGSATIRRDRENHNLSLVITDAIRDDRSSIEGVITTAGNLETAFLRTGFKDFFYYAGKLRNLKELRKLI